jgi:predicted RNA-binding Zn-ribbon protein involved in translation (DUF1610 family)
MAYPCPHCNQPVRRAASGATGFDHGGLLALLLGSAMADFECPRCGIIMREEFSAEVQAQMNRGSYMLIIIIALLAGGLMAGAVYYGAL